MEITNADGDKFVGKLNNGAPDEGTMVFAATGHTETGKWKDGLSPKEYEIKLKAETKAWLDAQRKAREARQQKEEQAKVQKLAQEKQKQQKEEQRKSLIQKIWSTIRLAYLSRKTRTRHDPTNVSGGN